MNAICAFITIFAGTDLFSVVYCRLQTCTMNESEKKEKKNSRTDKQLVMLPFMFPFTHFIVGIFIFGITRGGTEF